MLTMRRATIHLTATRHVKASCQHSYHYCRASTNVLSRYPSTRQSHNSTSQNPQKHDTLLQNNTSLLQQIVHVYQQLRNKLRNKLQNKLPKQLYTQIDKLRSRQWTQDSAAFINTLQSQWDKVSGYNTINSLRSKVTHLNDQLTVQKSTLLQTRQRYTNINDQKTIVQKEMNHLLQRRNSWGPSDVERFTELCRLEHKLEGEERDAKELLERCERETEETQVALLGAIRERYTTEQLWTTKIRATSTYYTSLLIITHLTMFVIVQIWIEPKKRREMVQSFVESVRLGTGGGGGGGGGGVSGQVQVVGEDVGESALRDSPLDKQFNTNEEEPAIFTQETQLSTQLQSLMNELTTLKELTKEYQRVLSGGNGGPSKMEDVEQSSLANDRDRMVDNTNEPFPRQHPQQHQDGTSPRRNIDRKQIAIHVGSFLAGVLVTIAVTR